MRERRGGVVVDSSVWAGGRIVVWERGGGRHNTTRPVEISDRQKMNKQKQIEQDY